MARNVDYKQIVTALHLNLPHDSKTKYYPNLCHATINLTEKVAMAEYEGELGFESLLGRGMIYKGSVKDF